MSEKTLADRCKRNGWKKGTKIRCSELCYGDTLHVDYIVTTVGRHEVLGMRIDLLYKTTCGEEIIRYTAYDRVRRIK